MKTLITKAWNRVTWANAKWFARTTATGWVIKGAIFGALTVCGVGAVGAMVTATVANWVVFLGQCVQVARAE